MLFFERNTARETPAVALLQGQTAKTIYRWNRETKKKNEKRKHEQATGETISYEKAEIKAKKESILDGLNLLAWREASSKKPRFQETKEWIALLKIWLLRSFQINQAPIMKSSMKNWWWASSFAKSIMSLKSRR